jgi:hypothetical protein
MSWTTGVWLATELTGPFVNGRQLFDWAGYRGSATFIANGLLMWASYALLRVALPVYILRAVALTVLWNWTRGALVRMGRSAR